MAGWKRRGRAQGIRKKKSTQTLARVAQRKEAQDEKMQRKFMMSRMKQLQHSNPSLVQSEANSQPDVLHNLLSQNQETDPRKIRNNNLKDNAYQILVEELQHPIVQTNEIEQTHQDHAIEEAETSVELLEEPTQSTEPPTTHQQRDVPIDLVTDESDEDEDVEASDITLENLCSAAATRENKHFGSSVTPNPLPEKSTTLCVIPGVGRISAALPLETRHSIDDCLNNRLDSITINDLGLQPVMYARFKALKGKHPQKSMSPIERTFLCSIREYSDVFLSRRLSSREEDGIRSIYAAHAVSHVTRALTRTVRNDKLLKSDEESNSAVLSEYKDQGFNRARVLIVVPMRNVAYEVVNTILALSVKEDENNPRNNTTVAYKQRFEDEFAPDDMEEDVPEDDAGEYETLQPSNIEDNLKKSKQKPADYRRTFRGNIDDDFKLGISFSRRAVKLYSDFFFSDIIVASPLGLSRTMAEKAFNGGKHTHQKPKQEEDTEWKSQINDDSRKRVHAGADHDFLSSIELCIIDGADVFSMQNWDTVRSTINILNKMPSDTRDTDFSRVRDWCLDNLMHKFRQTVMISKYQKSEFVGLMRECSNHGGIVNIVEPPLKRGTLGDVIVSMRQTFVRVEGVDSPMSSPEKRFAHFNDHMLPMIQSMVNSMTLLVVPSYFDFVRVRNKLVELSESESSFKFASMCEYSKASDISRARTRLSKHTVSLVVMTERLHFFYRHWLRGAEIVVWYGLPENAHFYNEILNMTTEAAEKGRATRSIALFDSFDAFRLARIVGSSRSKKMMDSGNNSTFLFV